MKLIDEAIELLGDASVPLGSAFIKAQIIAHKLKDKDFAQWVRNEIQGYADIDSVPDYRTARIIPHGALENLARHYPNMELSTQDMTKEMREKHLVPRFKQSIAVIEGFAQNGEQLTLGIHQGLYPFLMHGIDQSYTLIKAWGVLPEGTFTQIVNEARSRLMDLLLNLSDQIPDTADAENLADTPKIDGLNNLFKGAVFGHGANINFAIGDGNQASNNSTSVVENDMSSLLKELAERKVAPDDLERLQAAIGADATSAEDIPGSLGPKVRSWMGAMIAKAGTAAWDVPVQVGAAMLTTALSKYYGL